MDVCSASIFTAQQALLSVDQQPLRCSKRVNRLSVYKTSSHWRVGHNSSVLRMGVLGCHDTLIPWCVADCLVRSFLLEFCCCCCRIVVVTLGTREVNRATYYCGEHPGKGKSCMQLGSTRRHLDGISKKRCGVHWEHKGTMRSVNGYDRARSRLVQQCMFLARHPVKAAYRPIEGRRWGAPEKGICMCDVWPTPTVVRSVYETR